MEFLAAGLGAFENQHLEQRPVIVDLARRAVALEPDGWCHHATLALVLARLSKADETLKEAEKAHALARTPGERQRAEEVLACVKRISQ